MFKVWVSNCWDSSIAWSWLLALFNVGWFIIYDGWARNSGLAFQSIGKNWFIVVGHCSNWETIGVPLKSNQAKGRGVSKQRKEKLDQKKRNK